VGLYFGMDIVWKPILVILVSRHGYAMYKIKDKKTVANLCSWRKGTQKPCKI
jgi:hypothetical protein